MSVQWLCFFGQIDDLEGAFAIPDFAGYSTQHQGAEDSRVGPAPVLKKVPVFEQEAGAFCVSPASGTVRILIRVAVNKRSSRRTSS